MKQLRPFLQTAGSLWLAAALLLMIMIAMACATVFEVAHGPERTLQAFYRSWWFTGLLALLGLNALASMLARVPFTARQIGFAITHVSILLILVGAWVTHSWGIDGQVGLAEGQNTNVCYIAEQDSLVLTEMESTTRSSIDIDEKEMGRLSRGNISHTAGLQLGSVSVSIEDYLPDSIEVSHVLNDNEKPQAAAEISLTMGQQKNQAWIFAGGTTGQQQDAIVLRVARDEQELNRFLGQSATTQPASKGTVKFEIAGEIFEFPLEQCLLDPVRVGATGYGLRVLRYIPHALVGPDKQVHSASSQPLNPAIEVEITSPKGVFRRLAFARFPDFTAMHGETTDTAYRLRFEATSMEMRTAAVEVITFQEGRLYARFNPANQPFVVKELTPGTPVETPWPNVQLTVLRQFDHAREVETVEPATSERSDQTPAIRLTVSTSDGQENLWMRKRTTRQVISDGKRYTLTFAEKSIPLGFDLTLERFRIGNYPGTQRPRSFESSVVFQDPTTGREQSQVISMNHPASHGGYVLYQSSYRKDPVSGQSVSYLSIARDPGQPIVFAGYGGMLVGMVWVLVMRMIDWRKTKTVEAVA